MTQSYELPHPFGTAYGSIEIVRGLKEFKTDIDVPLAVSSQWMSGVQSITVIGVVKKDTYQILPPSSSVKSAVIV